MSMMENSLALPVLHSSTTSYKILALNGKEGYGQLATCVDMFTGEQVMIHMCEWVSDEEFAMLEKLRALNHDQHNIVKIIEDFQFQGISYLALEKLDRSLFDLVMENDMMPLSLFQIQIVAEQLLVALKALKGAGIIHTDLQPDKIRLVNQTDQPFRVKLTDFGQALPLGHMRTGMTKQPLAYRAPEVVLGIPLSESVDMWGLGCIMAYLYFGSDFFPDTCEYDWMKALLHWLGRPSDWMISAGIHSWKYFALVQDRGWELVLPEEYEDLTGVRLVDGKQSSFLSLEDAVMQRPEKPGDHEREERTAFLDFIRCCLNVSPRQRISPTEALHHRFLTMAELEETKEGTASTLINEQPPWCDNESVSSSDEEDCTEDYSKWESEDEQRQSYSGEQDSEAATSDHDLDSDAEVVRLVDGENHKTVGARWKKPFHSISKFFRRMQKGSGFRL